MSRCGNTNIYVNPANYPYFTLYEFRSRTMTVTVRHLPEASLSETCLKRLSPLGNVLTPFLSLCVCMCACVISGAVQWPRDLRSLVCRRTPAWNPWNEESPDCLRWKYLPCTDPVAHGEDSVPDFGLFLCSVAHSKGQIPQIYFSRKNGVNFLKSHSLFSCTKLPQWRPKAGDKGSMI